MRRNFLNFVANYIQMYGSIFILAFFLMDKQIYSLYELNSYVKQVLALNFELAIWIEAEISQIKFTRKHVYLDLIEKEDGANDIKAFAKAMIWFRTHQMLQLKYGEIASQILREGQNVKLSVLVQFHERYGYSLVIQDMDPEFTMGKLAIEREMVIRQLQKEKLIAYNRRNDLPAVIQNIAVLSSERAAGYQDFLQSIMQNPYHYYAEITLYPMAVQGSAVKAELLANLEQIREHQDYDCIVIIRGGGSRLDLKAFDDVDIARAIAKFPIAILTGIGHEIDICAADVVAYQHFKTPTAVAEFILQHNHNFEKEIEQLAHRLNYLIQARVHDENHALLDYQHKLYRAVQRTSDHLDTIALRIRNHTSKLLETKHSLLLHAERILRAIDPAQILQRGYSITTDNKGNIIKTAEQIKAGELIHTKFVHFSLQSKIGKIHKKDPLS